LCGKKQAIRCSTTGTGRTPGLFVSVFAPLPSAQTFRRLESGALKIFALQNVQRFQKCWQMIKLPCRKAPGWMSKEASVRDRLQSKLTSGFGLELKNKT
jgi:hypothetical protein